jgi:YD repeat-containing protein
VIALSRVQLSNIAVQLVMGLMRPAVTACWASARISDSLRLLVKVTWAKDAVSSAGGRAAASVWASFCCTTFNADDEPALVKDPNGNATLTCYDGDGNDAQTVRPTGVAAGSLTPASCPAAYPTGYSDRLAADATTKTYDAAGNVTQTTTPAPAGQSGSETTTYAYDANGNLTTTTTAPPATNGGPNQVTTDTYNTADELATETTGSGTSAAATVSRCYDPDGDVTSTVAPDGNTSGTATCETASPWVISSSSYPTQAAY